MLKIWEILIIWSLSCLSQPIMVERLWPTHAQVLSRFGDNGIATLAMGGGPISLGPLSTC